MTLWARHAGESKWHAISGPIGGRILSLCNGSWSASAMTEPGLVEQSLQPPEHERCVCCVARAPAPVEQFDDWPSAHELGGEA